MTQAAPVVLPYELITMTSEIDRAIEAGFYRVALTSALAMPDICAALELRRSDDVQRRHYVGWVEAYVDREALGCDAAQLYQLRCGVLHRGNATGHRMWEGTHVAMTTPVTGASLHGFSIAGHNPETLTAMFDLGSLWAAIRLGVYQWYSAKGGDVSVEAAVKRLLTLHPNGYFPILRGGALLVSELAV